MMKAERYLPGLPQFNLPFAFRLKGPLDVVALERSLVAVINRHESLRTRFAWPKGKPAAFVIPPKDIASLLVVEDMTAKKAAKGTRATALQIKKASSR